MYKASRRREYERVKMMDEEVAREKADEAFERRKEEMRRRDEEKTGRNRRRRERKRGNKGKGKEGGAEGGGGKWEGDGVGKSKLSRVALPGAEQGEESGDEVPAAIAEDVGVIIHDDD